MRKLWICALLSGCASVVPGTVARLQAVDPLTADPAGIVLAIDLPEGLAVGPEGARMTLDVTTGAGREVLALPLRTDGAEGLPEGDGAVIALALPEAEAARMRALQARLRGSDGGRVALGIGISGCTVGAGPAADARGAAWIRLAPDDPFRPLLRPVRIADLLGDGAMAGLRPCPSSRPGRR
jgi:hypothetical protein